MSHYLKMLCGLLFAALIAACGGGGGSAGTPGTGGNNGGSSGGTGTPTLTVSLITSTGTGTSTIGSVTPVYAKAILKDSSGAAVSGQVVTFTADANLLRFVPSTGTALTGADGVAQVQVLPVSADSAGAGTLKADSTVGTQAVTGTVPFQIPQGVSDVATSKVANFVLLTDKSTLANTGTATATVTVVAVDAQNNVVPGAAVTVSSDANTVFLPTGVATDAQGRYTGTLSTGSDKSDRTVTVTASVNGIVKKTAIQIAGSQIALTVTPTLLVPGGASSVSARLTDSASNPIANASISFGGDIAAIANHQLTTDSNGRVTLNFTAPAANGSYIVSATGSGISTQLSVQVSSGSVIPVASIPSGAVPSLSAIPNVISTNLAGSTSSQAQLRFLFIDPQNRPIPNVRVRFQIASTGLGSFDSSITTGTTTVYTNASGMATASLIAGATGSPTDGVIVRACYKASDFATPTECPSSVDVHLTIASQALSVSIGDDNVLTKGNGTYIKKFAVTVVDASGRAVAAAPVDISLDITHYGKGTYDQLISFPLAIGSSMTYVPDATTDPITFGARVSCINEDVNRNGIVDPGENINNSFDSFGQPTLEPRRSDIVLSYADPTVTTTNASGILQIQVEYSQRFATWLAYRIRATTSVAGSQGSAERAFVTDFADADKDNGSFHIPPYGTGSCSSAN